MTIQISTYSHEFAEIFSTFVVGTKFSVVSENGDIFVRLLEQKDFTKIVVSYDDYTLELSDNNTGQHAYRQLARSCIVHLSRLHAHRQIIVPLAIIIREGKILVSKRIDPIYKEMDGKWEFPGGGVEPGEQIEKALQREVKEEVGLDVLIVKQFQYIHVVTHPHSSLYLMPFLCTIVSGEPSCLDGEVSEVSFVTLEKFYTLSLISENNVLMKNIEPELKEFLSYDR